MCDYMRLRGPDSEGAWSHETIPTALGFRRLAIIDLEARANQPMVSDDARYVIVFNGEIYNYKELRSQLQVQGEIFRTESDTEVILKLYARRGCEMLSALRGMFAIAIWDSLRQEVFLARDPYGIKPLYLARTASGWIFASQVKALLHTGLVSRDPDPIGQAGFWLLGSVPEPHTWFRDIQEVAAGSYVTIRRDGRLEKRCWANIGDVWRAAESRTVPLDEVRDCVHAALRQSVAAHLVADVPVGVFLSGGIDSGSLAALMVEAGARSLIGVTVGFEEFSGSEQDEIPLAREVASRYGILHSSRVINRTEFQDDLPLILAAMDQPSVDGINTWYASKAVGELELKVVVSGVGGDELFQGYSSFRQLPAATAAWRAVSHLPLVKSLVNASLKRRAIRSRNPRWLLLPKLLNSVEGAWFLRRGLFSPMELPDVMGPDLALEASKAADELSLVHEIAGPLPGDARLKLSQIESLGYLRNQLLRDSDWASMSHSVELRTPLVDFDLLRALGSVMASLKRFPHKSLLSSAPSTPLPETVASKPKTGFGIPIQTWLAQMGMASANGGMSRDWAKVVAKNVYA
jgi:asparagine synthase (glutamine-hydrolysing)